MTGVPQQWIRNPLVEAVEVEAVVVVEEEVEEEEEVAAWVAASLLVECLP